MRSKSCVIEVVIWKKHTRLGTLAYTKCGEVEDLWKRQKKNWHLSFEMTVLLLAFAPNPTTFAVPDALECKMF